VAPHHSAALSLDQVLDIAFEQFAQAPQFRQRRIPRPLYADEESFRLLVDGVTPVASGLLARALNRVAPFAPQLYVHKQLDNTRLGQALRLCTAADSVRLVANTCQQLIGGWEGPDAGR